MPLWLRAQKAHKITEIIEEKLKKTVEGQEEVIIHVEPKDKRKSIKGLKQSQILPFANQIQ